MRHLLPTSLLALLLLPGLPGCSDDSTGPGDIDALGPISGSITLAAEYETTPVVMGNFDWLSVITEGDAVTSMDGDPPHTPQFALTVSSTGTSRTYTYELPSDPDQFSLLMAWVDLDGDGLFDEGDEPARLPVKVIEGTPEVVDFWGGFTVNGTAGYTISAGDSQYRLDVVGDGGFDFTF